MSGNKRYVYGVTDDPPEPFEAEAVEGSTEVYPVEHRNLAALVSDVDTLDPEESEENTRAHDEVLREVVTRGDGRTVAPMQFGMVFEGNRTLKNVLRHGRPGFVGALRDVEGCVELGLKVVAPEEGPVDDQEVQEIVGEALDPVVERVERGDRFSDRLVLNRSYLVSRDDRDAFDEAVEELRDRLDECTLRYTGPWAPYSFVDLEIGVAQ